MKISDVMPCPRCSGTGKVKNPETMTKQGLWLRGWIGPCPECKGAKIVLASITKSESGSSDGVAPNRSE